MLVKFAKVLERRGIEAEEVFNLCDVDNSGFISLKELETFLTGIKIGFLNKEIHALMTLLDTNASGEISLEEFMSHMNKGVKAFKIDNLMGTYSAPPPQQPRKVNNWTLRPEKP